MNAKFMKFSSPHSWKVGLQWTPIKQVSKQLRCHLAINVTHLGQHHLVINDPEYKCKNLKKLYQIKLKELYGITNRDKKRNITVVRINSYVQDFAKLMKAFKVYDRECHYDLEYRVVIFFENIIPMSDRYHTY